MDTGHLAGNRSVLCVAKARQEIAQESEIIKDICGTLTSLKSDSPKASAIGGAEPSRQYEEPTRDPDVWPPPTPVEPR